MNTYIVTLKLARNPGHNPAAKVTAPLEAHVARRRKQP